jgi:RHS repeat-associated protein
MMDKHNYERNAGDPRVSHAFTLEVDDHGVVRRSAAVGYPRRAVHQAFAEQGKVTITLSEVDVVHHAPTGTADWYRIGVPIATRSYEVTGLVPPPDGVFSFAAVLGAADAATALPYEATPDGVTVQKRLLSEARSLYQADDLSGPLALGVVASLALPYESYAKAFTPALLASALGGRATDDILTEGGYVRFLPGDDAWWVPSGRQTFDSAQFYLPVAFTNPFNNTTTVTYDIAYHLFVTQVVDPLGNTVHAAYDMRTLSPWEITDPNGNRAQARFDEFGMVVATAVMGKVNSSDGDTLADPTTTFAYDLDRFRTTGKPNVVHARAREQHGAANTRWQETYSYSDGSGHEVMRKVQAEPGQAPQRDATTGALVHAQGKLVFAETSSRWVGSGRTVLDNKGHPVKQYEPFFSGEYEYEDETELVEWGVTPVMRYDALGRLVRTDLPNGTFSKVAFDPWQETHHDPNDTVLESLWYAARQGLDASTDPEGRAAALTAAHANTPGVVHLDALGRPFRALEDNGSAGQYATTTTLDIEGNALLINDHRGVVVQRSVFGMGGHKLRQESCDAGKRWMLGDVGGAMLRGWDERGFTHRTAVDELRRVTHVYALPPANVQFPVQPPTVGEVLVERTVYGEALLASAATTNHRGKPYLHYDGAGVVTSVEFDFKGNLLEGQRRLARAYDGQVSWGALDLLTDPAAIVAAVEAQLETEIFRSKTEYDALNRPTRMTTHDSSVILPRYNEAGLLEQVQVRVRGAATPTTFVNDIDYDAKGQREKIVYGADVNGNGTTTTTYTYDPLTYRLTRLKTTRASDDAVLQNLAYAYDPVGNITEIGDSAQQAVFFANDVALPKMAYVYDALYRLINATGRELTAIAASQPADGDVVPASVPASVNDTQAMRPYTESYEYDAIGNILRMIHDGGSPETSWTRRYGYAVDGSGNPVSNRLTGTSLPGDLPTQLSAQYGYDEHGNMVSMPHLAAIGWNHRDEMVSADKGGGGMVYFTYDSAGQRVRKVWVHNGLVEERIYIGGGFEVYRRRVGTSIENSTELTLERQTLHVMDGVRRIALVETKTADSSVPPAMFVPSTMVRFQMGNHLGSAVLEVDPDGMVISYEEYHPYGTTAYLAGTSAAEVSRKRYRYTGKERDEETGLYYHGARYYAPWLGRWTAADPLGLDDGLAVFSYCHSNPVAFTDPTGAKGTSVEIRTSEQPKGLPKGKSVRVWAYLPGRKGAAYLGNDQAVRKAAGEAGVPVFVYDPAAPKAREAAKQALLGDLNRAVDKATGDSGSQASKKEPSADGGNGTPKGFDESAALALARAAAVANLESPYGEKGGDPYGVAGGANPNASSSPLKQAVFSAAVIAITAIDIKSIIADATEAVLGKISGSATRESIGKAVGETVDHVLKENGGTVSKEVLQDAAKATAEKAAKEGWINVARGAEERGKSIINALREEAKTAAHESGRHTWPRKAAQALEKEAQQAEKQGMLPEYVKKLREMADTMRKREAGHRGGIVGRGAK